MRLWITLVEGKKPVTRYKVAFSWKEFKYEPLAGSFYHVDAVSEMDAKRQVRRILTDSYPFGGWRVLYAFEHPRKVDEGLNSLQCDPVYDHDCPRCVFCGQTAFRGHNMVDVYACNPSRPNKDEMSVIVRYSDEPGEYSAIRYASAQTNPAYKDAVELVNQKLNPKTVNEDNLIETGLLMFNPPAAHPLETIEFNNLIFKKQTAYVAKQEVAFYYVYTKNGEEIGGVILDDASNPHRIEIHIELDDQFHNQGFGRTIYRFLQGVAEKMGKPITAGQRPKPAAERLWAKRRP